MIGIQQKRSKGWRKPANCMYVGRLTRFGNPYKAGDINDNGEVVTRSQAVDMYRFYLTRKYPGDSLCEFLAPLAGKDVSCWYKVGEPCHRDVLIDLVTELFPEGKL